MPKKRTIPVRDKRTKLDLELFVLAFMERGVNTPYRLQAEVGLSPGATLPVLARLQQAGYVRRGKPGPRRRSEYEITASGRALLKSEWRALMDGPVPPDIETVFRIAVLALLSGADKSVVSNYLRLAADARQQEGRYRRNEDQPAISWQSAASIGDLYTRMRAVHAIARLNNDARVLRDLANRIKKTERP
jgi:DNA-binding PadR family transcriptional regulator